MRCLISPRVCLLAVVLLASSSAAMQAGQRDELCGSAAVCGDQQPKPSPQQPKPSPGQPRPAPAPQPDSDRQARREPEGRPVNLQIELTITDQVESEPAQKKTVSMIVADRSLGRIRSSGQRQVPGPGPNFVTVQINIDATPAIQPNEAVRLQLTLEYRPASQTASTDAAPGPAMLNESLVVFLQPGKPLTISRAVDPVTNRRTTVDVTATIMK